MSNRKRTKARERGRNERPLVIERSSPLALAFTRDPETGARIATGSTFASFRYVIRKHPRGGWDVEVFRLNRVPMIGGEPAEDLLARAHCKTAALAEAWCSRDFIAHRC